jgi:energy-coupling factor transporter ATP-binding protein EcfA2
VPSIADSIKPLKSELGAFFSVVVAGPGGTGKSTFLGTMAKYVKDTYGKKTLLIATLPREMRSWKYQELGEDYIDCIVIEDKDWMPELSKYTATGFTKTLKLFESLYEDDTYGAVILDNGTEHGEQAWHNALAPWKISSPADMPPEESRNRWLPYDRLDSMLDQSINSLVGLTTAPTPKFVGIAWHVQAPKDDTVESVGMDKVKKESADNKNKGVEYEGEVLPMIRGKFRRKLINKVEAMLYTNVDTRREFKDGKIRETTEYLLQVHINDERHTKLPGPMPEVSHIPNDFQSLVDVLRGKYTPVIKEKDASAPTLKYSKKK